MTSYRASWVLPISGPPLRDAWVSVSDGLVTEVGTGRAPSPVVELGDVALLPGLVNAHTHLELSWMAGLVPPAGSMDEWIKTLLSVRRAGPAGGDETVVTAMTRAVGDILDTGTALVGDISNSLMSVPVFAARELACVVFHEILGFNPADPQAMVRDAQERRRVSLKRPLRSFQGVADPKRPQRSFSDTPDVFSAVVGHAPYSTAPALFAEIAAQHQGPAPLSVHIAESAEEVEFLHTGQGPMRTLLETLGVWTGAWQVPRCGPLEFLKRLGYLKPGTLLVHGVHLTVRELEQARDAEAVIVTCPRSNTWVGGGVPPIARFYGAGVPVAIGTDSLASAETLNMFDELAALRRLAPEVDAAQLLDSATRVGAEALGFGQHYGTISPGRQAQLVSVALPAGVRGRPEDVEEYLVSGVSAADVSRLNVPSH